MRIGFIISLVFAIIVTLFGIQNAAIISVNFFIAKFQISLALIIFVSAIIGAIVVTLFGFKKELKLSRGNTRLTKKFENHEKETLSLKMENENFKSKIEALQTEIQALEIKNKTLNDEIRRLNNI
ncbi:lipopolysaccharide assembly protein LapA domain-containing protein [Clostridium akagii]|uniref:lipopolysaccharide assembly protein LapA domain-containing protein n=1 Tax=Clostridium akagii TaxID=91623 RepID=UPI0006912066|nr:lipopolysaccharide assembly protein LapA domain-containing protein [Clostridium akagii]